MKRSVIGVGTFLLGMSIWSSAHAQACAGVEARVNTRTSQLTTAITTQITARTAAIVTQETLQRQQLLSALRVMVRQESLSNEQEVNADNSAQLAMSNVIVEDSVARQTHNAVTNYGSTGHAACALVEAGATVADMMDSYSEARELMAEAVRENRTAGDEEEFREQMASWANLVRDADDATVQALLSGDEDAARAFIAVVAGPPHYPQEAGSGSVLSRMDRVATLRDEARNSAAVYALADLSAQQGLRVALDDMADIWVGEDGGEEWAARMAASPTRAVLLDTARIEAHNIAVAALELRQGVMNEFALSVFALSHIDAQREAQLEDAQ